MKVFPLSHQHPPWFGRWPVAFHYVTLLLVGPLLVVTAGCAQGDSAPTSQEAATYAVRGVVRSLPQPAAARQEINIRHEAIDDFVDIRGRIVGMDSMTMPFPVADEETLAEISPGDTVQFELVVDWEGSPPVVIRQLHKLDAGTELEFREARAAD